MTELNVAHQLLERFHASVADRRVISPDGLPFSVLVEAARLALAANPWLPSMRRADDIFDGIILERRGSEYWVHERHEVGVSRYSEVRSHHAKSLDAAVREYIAPFDGSIDGVRIDPRL
jgi:hypothetical protein